MANITLAVINPAETEKTTFSVRDDVIVRDLVRALVEELDLPKRSGAGHLLRYRLSVATGDESRSVLDERQELDEQGVTDGTLLQLSVEMRAGGDFRDFLDRVIGEDRTIEEDRAIGQDMAIAGERDLREQLISDIAEAVERRLLVRVLSQSRVRESLDKSPRGAIAVRPVFGMPSDAGQYACDAFMLMPFSEEFESIYADYIKPTVEKFSLKMKRADDFFTDLNIIDDIWSAIAGCRFVVADCTGRNANVFYELGIAHTLGKPAILLTQRIEDLPFDVQGRRAIVYEDRARGLMRLQQELGKAVQVLTASEHDEWSEIGAEL